MSRSGSNIPSSARDCAASCRTIADQAKGAWRTDSTRRSCASTTFAALSATNLFAADAEAVGRAFAATLAEAGGHRRVAVGYDGRLTSPELEAALVEGLAAGGIDVVRIGRGPTPMLYFAAATLGVDGGVMVTGSHNPPDHNGFKMVLGGKPFYAEAIQALGADRRRRSARRRAARSGRGAHAIAEDYIARLARDFDAASRSTSPGTPATARPATSSRELTAASPGRRII